MTEFRTIPLSDIGESDTLPRCAPIDPTKPPIDVCPLRGAR